MTPNRSLSDILVTARPSRSDYQVLTPRTPHSRAGRAEEGFTEVELDVLQDDDSNDYRNRAQQQSRPLLSPGYRSRGDDHDDGAKETDTRTAKHWVSLALGNLPLIGGSISAIALFVLIAVSVTHPGTLEAMFLQATPDGILTSGSSLTAPTSQATSLSTSTSMVNESTHSHSRVISYTNYTRFPLTGSEYRAECDKLMRGHKHYGDFWDLPLHGPLDVEHHDDTALPQSQGSKVCSGTITYMLDGEMGLTADLALLAQAAALARDRNRTFLVDDTYWNRGKWTDHFQDVRVLYPGPEPGCRAPPPEELVACPRTARHWVLSSSTAMYHMGHPFAMEYENAFGHHMNRVKPIFQRAQISFEQVIRPNAGTTALIHAAREELATAIPNQSPVNSSADAHTNPAPYIGVHIRRGDRLPTAISFYPNDQIPLEKYMNRTYTTWNRFYGSSLSGTATSSANAANIDYADAIADDYAFEAPIVWLGSDSPEAAGEFAAALSPGTALFSLSRSANSEFVALAPTREYVQAEFSQEPLEVRLRLTKGMIVDLAMLSGMWASSRDIVPSAVVCAEGSNVCRMAAIPFGFERAFGFDDDGNYYMGDPNRERARWVDVDIDGRIIPAWHPFEFH